MRHVVVLENDRFGNPLLASISIRTTFFTRKTVLINGTPPFDKDAVVLLSRGFYQTHVWNLQGMICVY
jgi:hypothetical protein